MGISLKNIGPRWNYIFNMALVAVLYFSTAKLGDLLTFINIFNHNQYPPYWPPSGVAFAFVLIMGRTALPGIVIASLLLMYNNYIFPADASLPKIILISASLAVARVLEPLAGRYLLQRWCDTTDVFASIKTAFCFIVTTLVISVIGAGMSSTVIQLAIPQNVTDYLIAMFAWYIDNVVGILLFAPFFLALASLQRKPLLRKSKLAGSSIILFTAVCLFFIKPVYAHSLVINSLPYLVLPILLWLAFKFHLVVSSLAGVLMSILAIYFTTHGVGSFADGDWQNSVWLLQSFLLVVSVSIILSSAAANERRANENQLEQQALELQKSNQNLRYAMEHLADARNKAEESDRLKSAFLANISHEIRTPMNAILGFAELLERPALEEEKRKSFLSLIRARSKDLLGIVNDILDVSKIEAGQISTLPVAGNVNEVFDRQFAILKSETFHLQKKNIEVKMANNLKSQEAKVVADFSKLEQVLNNLLKNASKFTKQGFIEMGCTKENGRELLFFVRDSGIGIEPDKLDFIFKPFHQASESIHQEYGGSGLGLTICKGLVESWGGKIWVESEVGKGSVFYFTMPYVPAEKA